MDQDKRERQRLKHRAAGLKASETKGPEQRSRAAKAAAWTRKHGKDSPNPYAKTADDKKDYTC